MAVAGFVIGLLALFAGLGGSVLGWFLAALAIILSVLGISRSGAPGSGKGLAITGLILGAIGFFGAIGHLGTSTTTTAGTAPPYSASATYTAPSAAIASAAPTTAVETGPVTTFSDGTYEIGTGSGQVAPGTYRTPGDQAYCYWSRNKDTSGEFGSIITNGVAQGPTVITVGKNDGALELSGGCTWTKK